MSNEDLAKLIIKVGSPILVFMLPFMIYIFLTAPNPEGADHFDIKWLVLLIAFLTGSWIYCLTQTLKQFGILDRWK